jgi:hypothetical protein
MVSESVPAGANTPFRCSGLIFWLLGGLFLKPFLKRRGAVSQAIAEKEEQEDKLAALQKNDAPQRVQLGSTRR